MIQILKKNRLCSKYANNSSRLLHFCVTLYVQILNFNIVYIEKFEQLNIFSFATFVPYMNYKNLMNNKIRLIRNS